ncbi:MtrAB system histidine kinase MtrB [Kocuria turfanensis]|uniref:Sensor histidine kinase MtrB n=1 Tax=Kocuria turfanensis TaxID=388357 RepID=A0A512I8G4_9MICC|nr:MtrAB system histidine kinase MtrB [Kocuria turfanensis]GEO93994.1 two-component sensor histidine kinase [Kocuria turfanensis]
MTPPDAVASPRRRGPVRATGRRLQLFRLLLARRWRQSLQFRAIAVSLSLTALAFFVTGSFLSHQIADRLFSERLDQVLASATADFEQVQDSFDASDASDRDELQALVASSLGALSVDGAETERWILLPMDYTSGQTLIPAQSQSPWMTSSTVPQELQERLAEQDGVFWQPASVPMTENGDEAPVVVVGTVVELYQNSRYGLYLVYDFSEPQRTLDAMHAVLLLSVVVLLLLVGAIVWYVTREVVRPVSSTARVAEQLAEGDLGVRLPVSGSHEVARLARSFNRMADSLQEQITQLEQLSSMQQTFVSDVSHELRTPLTTVRMAAEVLFNAREDFDPVNRRSAELLYHQVDRFDSLLADLLEISRFDAGAARLEVTSVELFSVVHDVVEGAAPLAVSSGSAVRVRSELSRCTVQGDQRRIERILRNLVVNALEHGEGRPIDIVVGASDVAAAVAVRDHGIGMDEEEAEKVFNRFWRADPARARTTGGTGLGLAIATEDTRLHGGRLDVWGAPGEGACFRLTLPRTRARRLGPEDPSPVGLPPDAAAYPETAEVTATGTLVLTSVRPPEQTPPAAPADEEGRP